MQSYEAIHLFLVDKETSREELLIASKKWREEVSAILLRVDPSFRGTYCGHGFLVVTQSKETFEKLLEEGFVDYHHFREFQGELEEIEKRSKHQHVKLMKEREIRMISEIDSLSIGEYIPDKELVVIFYPDKSLNDYLHRLGDNCYVLSLEQFTRLHLCQERKTLYAMKHQDESHRQRFYFHPAKVVEFVNHEIGHRSRLIQLHEKLSLMYHEKNLKLIPLFPLESLSK